MISSLTGELFEVQDDRAYLKVGPIIYELLIPAADVPLLQSGVGEGEAVVAVLCRRRGGSVLAGGAVGLTGRAGLPRGRAPTVAGGIAAAAAVGERRLEAGQLVGGKKRADAAVKATETAVLEMV